MKRESTRSRNSVNAQSRVVRRSDTPASRCRKMLQGDSSAHAARGSKRSALTSVDTCAQLAHSTVARCRRVRHEKWPTTTRCPVFDSAPPSAASPHARRWQPGLGIKMFGFVIGCIVLFSSRSRSSTARKPTTAEVRTRSAIERNHLTVPARHQPTVPLREVHEERNRITAVDGEAEHDGQRPAGHSAARAQRQ